jgi:hypothetical protein
MASRSAIVESRIMHSRQGGEALMSKGGFTMRQPADMADPDYGLALKPVVGEPHQGFSASPRAEVVVRGPQTPESRGRMVAIVEAFRYRLPQHSASVAVAALSLDGGLMKQVKIDGPGAPPLSPASGRIRGSHPSGPPGS